MVVEACPIATPVLVAADVDGAEPGGTRRADDPAAGPAARGPGADPGPGRRHGGAAARCCTPHRCPRARGCGPTGPTTSDSSSRPRPGRRTTRCGDGRSSCTARSGSLTASSRVLVHRDYHSGNVLFDPETGDGVGPRRLGQRQPRASRRRRRPLPLQPHRPARAGRGRPLPGPVAGRVGNATATTRRSTCWPWSGRSGRGRRPCSEREPEIEALVASALADVTP